MNIKKELRNINCKDYCENNDLKYIVLENAHIEKVACPNYLETDNNEIKYVDVFHPEIYVAELPHVNVLGASSIVFDDNYNCIFDTPFIGMDDRWDLSYYATYYVDKYVTCIDYNDSFETIAEGIMLLAPTSANFYHFNLEILTKLCIINELDEYKTIPLLVDERIRTIPGFQEELDFVNKLDRKIIYLKEFHSYKVRKLIYISNLTITTPGFKPNINAIPSENIMNSNAIKLLNKTLSKKGTPSKRIFISRNVSPNSRLSNQGVVNEIFKGFGYEIVFTELLSLTEKRNLFSEAEFIASPFGSGLTNILFANENSTIICIQPKVYGEAAFSCISNILNQKCYYIDAIPNCSQPYNYLKILHSRPTVDIASLVEFLNRIHSK